MLGITWKSKNEMNNKKNKKKIMCFTVEYSKIIKIYYDNT